MQLEPARDGRSMRASQDSTTDIAADIKVIPLRDHIILEPLNVVLSKVIIVKEETKPLRGIIKAIGPGHYPMVYDDEDKHRRKKMWLSDEFQHTVCQVGDVVELGGYEFRGYSFPTFYWGGKLHLIVREADVSGVVDISADEARRLSEEYTI